MKAQVWKTKPTQISVQFSNRKIGSVEEHERYPSPFISEGVSV